MRDPVELASNIIENEKYNLEQTERILDDAEFTQNRIIHFNEDLRKRYEDFNYIIITFVIAFSIIFICIMLQNLLSYLTENESTMIPIVPIASIVLSIAIIVSFFKYYNISSRWNMNYDVYNYPPPILQTQPQSIVSTSPVATTDTAVKYCVGEKCCSDGTTWDVSNNICVPTPISNNSSNNIQPFEPSMSKFLK